jgi:succinate-acetate transporter protein
MNLQARDVKITNGVVGLAVFVGGFGQFIAGLQSMGEGMFHAYQAKEGPLM